MGTQGTLQLPGLLKKFHVERAPYRQGLGGKYVSNEEVLLALQSSACKALFCASSSNPVLSLLSSCEASSSVVCVRTVSPVMHRSWLEPVGRVDPQPIPGSGFMCARAMRGGGQSRL